MTNSKPLMKSLLSSGSDQIYDCIVIGGGAAGLFYAAGDTCGQGCSAQYGAQDHSTPRAKANAKPQKLILEKTSRPGQKLLLSGNGMCNITHSGSIKDFVSKYGEHGGSIRGCLYRHSNLQLMAMMNEAGVPVETREDGKVFPKSKKASDVLSALQDKASRNGFQLICNAQVTGISLSGGNNIASSGSGGIITVHLAGEKQPVDNNLPEAGDHLIGHSVLKTRKLVIATGGASYPATGSDGSFFEILKRDLGLEIVTPRPALSPVYIAQYPYAELAGISFADVEATCGGHTCRGAMLLTHRGFSGPAFLHLSQYAKAGAILRINYLPDRNINEVYRQLKSDQPGNNRSITNYLADAFGLPKAFARAQLANPDRKLSSVGHKELENIVHLLMDRQHIISGTGGWNAAMVTAGGIALGQMDLKTMRLKQSSLTQQEFSQDIRIIGEALDINGDTGGYNLQFAYSSAMAALD